MTKRVLHFQSLALFFLLSYLLLLLNMVGYLAHISYPRPATAVFAAAVFLSYGFLYMLPALLPAFACDALLSRRTLSARLGAWAQRGWIAYAVAVLGMSLVQLGILIDKRIFDIYGFHFNGVVWNVIVTPGGMDSLGVSVSTVLTVSLVILGIVAAHALLMGLALRAKRLRRLAERFLTPRRCIAVAGMLLLLGVGQTGAYGVSWLRGYSPEIAAADAFPFYLPVTFSKLARRLGLGEGRDAASADAVDAADVLTIRYPKHPIEYRADSKPYNIVCLVTESLRGDQLDPEIMPATWDFAQRAIWFRGHYSSGNRTARALFGMFYGLYGNYWPAFRRESRAPVLMELLRRRGYQLGLYNSAKFSFPELDRTIFAGVPRDMLHDGLTGTRWERDRKNVDELLRFIAGRDRERPFLAFMFFDSPHARYEFPPEAALRKPYLEQVNYVTMDTARDAPLLKNRYINSSHYVDTQTKRVLDYLRTEGLLDSTIVIITGDHGEEFMEKGWWGHGSAFTEEQTLVPMVLSVPGRPARQVTRLTNHVDIVPTLMPLLGVTNPPQDYTQGADMLAPEGPDYCIVAESGNLAIVDETHKVILPSGSSSLRSPKVTTRDDAPVPDSAAVLGQDRARILAVLQQLKEFEK
jgi:hypothetical protein